MITLKQVREQVKSDPLNWQVYLMDFVDEFRRSRDLKLVREPFILAGDENDALLASTAEALCDELGLDVPKWLENVPGCKKTIFCIRPRKS